MVRVCENRSGRATAADFLQHLAVRHLRKSAAAKLRRRRHSQHADARETVDQFAWDIFIPIDGDRIESSIEKLPDFRERSVQLRLLRRRDARIRHRPIRDKLPEEQSLGETKFLTPGKEQLLGLLNFLLSLDFRFVHRCTKVEIEGNASCIPGSFRTLCRRRRPRRESPWCSRNASS